MRLPTYKLPGRPDPLPSNTPIPYVGPYGEQQALAQRAYEQALSQINSQRSQTLQQYGFMPGADGNAVIDPSNPYGMLQQTYLTNQQEADSLEQGARSRGFSGSGLGQQGVNAGRVAEGARLFDVGQRMLGSITDLSQQQAGAQFNLDTAALQNREGSTQYAIDHGMFTPAAPYMGNAAVQARIKKMAAAWAKKYGTRDRNRNGLTFQQRLDKLGAANLYNPTAKNYVAGRYF